MTAAIFENDEEPTGTTVRAEPPAFVDEGSALLDEALVAEDERDMATLLTAFGRWDEDGAGPVRVVIRDRQYAWIIMSALQLAWRHPALPFREYIEEVARQIQDEICDQEDISALAEAGWNPGRDR